MRISTTPIHRDVNHDPLTWELHLDTGYTQQQVYNELISLDWTTAHQCAMPNRLEMRQQPTSPCLFSIQEYLHSPEIKQSVLDLLYKNQIYSYWSITPEDMSRITVTGGLFVKDLPGFSCPRHVDTRSLICTGMLMFGPEDVPEHRTFFYRTDKDTEKYWESNSKFEHGWLNATLHNTWHEGYNKSNVDRYAYLFHISLKIF
jgi:hypothetical protein